MGITIILCNEDRLLTRRSGPRQEGGPPAPLPPAQQLALWQISLTGSPSKVHPEPTGFSLPLKTRLPAVLIPG